MSRMNRLRPLAGLLAAGLAAPAFADPSTPFPTYWTGPQPDGSWVVSSGQVITPAGIQVDLGERVRAKAIAVNPNKSTHTAAVLTLGATQAVEVFDIRTGNVLQIYLPFQDSSGSYGGITYSADGTQLMFSQDSSHVTFANVDANGLLTDKAQVSVPPNNSLIQCFPQSQPGSYDNPCGSFYSGYTSYPGGVAFSKDGKTAYALLNQDDGLTSIDLTQPTLTEGTEIRVGNAPHSILINGTTAYVSNEGGRAATASDATQIYSAGTPIVADPVSGAAVTGTVSVVDLTNMTVTNTIATTGLHPTGMAQMGHHLLVANTYSDTIDVINMMTNKVSRTISLALPNKLKVPGQKEPVYGAAPVSIAVDAEKGVAYVACYNANAIAVVDLSAGAGNAILGYIPVGYAPASVALNAAENTLIVANDKGIGARFSFETDHGVTGYNTHQDNGTVSIIRVPNPTTLAEMTEQVHQNNHWDLKGNIKRAGNGSGTAQPVPLPVKIGDPSLIKHVFLIVRENRTYDQILGDITTAYGDPELAVFAPYTPNAHALVQRFPLLDNFYDPSRQSADGHQWIVEAMAPYADDIQSPDWVRSYPGGNAGDSLAYLPKGFLFQEADAAGLSVKIYGEYVEYDTWENAPGGTEPSWAQFYADSQAYEAGTETTLQYQNATTAHASVPIVNKHLVTNFPLFDLNIPDQFRVDLWVQDFNNDVTNGTVPSLSILWIMDDHTGGPPPSSAEQADNDLAVGRIIDYISHSSVWSSSAIFMEEDDAQNGVDHVDGHRSPGYIVSPYAVQGAPTDHTYYTQVNMTRTIEQILGLPPMNQFDLVASPMRTDFVNVTSFSQLPATAQLPFTHVPATVSLVDGTPVTPAAVKVAARSANAIALEKAWKAAKVRMFAGKLTKPDSVDADTLNHLDWYEATNFTKPYPGESKVRMPTDFKNRFAEGPGDKDD
ncbi:MAG TPA: bifunctional YncE family protein/alkaline phosphatase family protein [Stellaceae bacterium]|nr:bifunctional YncE family protein/alkaline phosphatase family protein [Stellaceae bacterium]